MTNREFYEAIINGTVNDEIIEKAKAEVEKMDARNAKRASTPSKTAVANAPLIEAISGILTTEPMTAAEVAEKMEITTAKASALLRKMEGLTVTEVKAKGRKVKGYAIAE